MVSDKFRRQLRQEALKWQADQLISPDQYRRLAARYQFSQIDTNARDRFIAILMVLGGVLLGIGVLTFVAANWQSIPRSVKMALLLLLLVAVEGTGFYLWRWRSPSERESPRSSAAGMGHAPRESGGEVESESGVESGNESDDDAGDESDDVLEDLEETLGGHRESWQRRLGHGLLIFGCLILGGNLALMGQLFHQSGSAAGLCLVWGLGVAAMSYGLRLTSLGVLSAALMGVGYWTGIRDFTFGDASAGLQPILTQMPLIAALLFVPLAYWCRSRVVFGIAAIATVSSFVVVLTDLWGQARDPFGVTAAIAFTLPIALLWAYDGTLWTQAVARLRGQSEPTPPETLFRPVARVLAIVGFCGLVYGLSFYDIWNYWTPLPAEDRSTLLVVVGTLLSNPSFLIVGALALAFWIYLGWPRIGQQWRLVQTDLVLLVMLIIVGLLPIWHLTVTPIPVVATVLLNGLLFVLAAGLIREGLADGDRRQFWFGLLLLILQLLSRVFEYETGLLLKSMVFLLCGVAVIVIGLWFERYVRSFDSPDSDSDFPHRRINPARPDEEVS